MSCCLFLPYGNLIASYGLFHASFVFAIVILRLQRIDWEIDGSRE